MDAQALISPEALVLALESCTGRQRTRLLKAGRERFRGELFNALLLGARERFNKSESACGVLLLDLATRLVAKGANVNAKGKMCFAGELAQTTLHASCWPPCG